MTCTRLIAVKLIYPLRAQFQFSTSTLANLLFQLARGVIQKWVRNPSHWIHAFIGFNNNNNRDDGWQGWPGLTGQKEENKKENCRGRDWTDGVERSIKGPRGPNKILIIFNYHISIFWIIMQMGDYSWFRANVGWLMNAPPLTGTGHSTTCNAQALLLTQSINHLYYYTCFQ